jgi:cytidine deaminase
LAGSDPLLDAARAAFDRAIAPYSGFHVGAALETTSGTIVAGSNIENASYGLTMCAERVAMFKALSDGHRAFRRILIFADTATPTPPCGACRQILWEFAGDLEVLLANRDGIRARHTMADLLPGAFDSRFLHQKHHTDSTDSTD